jgi:ABC-type antimicrobial peptide transport system permease subunit
MPGIAEIALGAAPIAGGALVGIAAGGIKGPDVRSGIIKDLDLLERIPPEQVERRQRLQQAIYERIDDLIATAERTRELRLAAASYKGNWRDVVVFVCAVLFTIVWWHVSHSRSNWLVMFILLIVFSVISGIYAARGLFRAVRRFLRRKDRNSQ